MRRCWKLGVAVLVGAAIAVPATVLARGAVDASGDADNFQVDTTGKVSTTGTGYHTLPLGVSTSDGPLGVTVSAQMLKGKAKFRVLSNSAHATPPSVLFTARGSNSFTFGLFESCDPLRVEWKRVGKQQAVAAKVSVLTVQQQGTCV
jgi:hypothetical protein